VTEWHQPGKIITAEDFNWIIRDVCEAFDKLDAEMKLRDLEEGHYAFYWNGIGFDRVLVKPPIGRTGEPRLTH
jgi:hypothetical protein